MSFFTDLTSVTGDIFDELGVPTSTVQRRVKRVLTDYERARDMPDTEIITFNVRAVLDTEDRKADDGTITMVTEAILDREVIVGDIIDMNGHRYTVKTVKKNDPVGAGAIYYEAVLV